jgi:hypothetical protein
MGRWWAEAPRVTYRKSDDHPFFSFEVPDWNLKFPSWLCGFV